MHSRPNLLGVHDALAFVERLVIGVCFWLFAVSPGHYAQSPCMPQWIRQIFTANPKIDVSIDLPYDTVALELRILLDV